MGVAVEVAALEIGAAIPRPLPQTFDLSLAKGRRAQDPARVSSPDTFEFDGEDVGYAEPLGDGAGDKAVAGGDDGRHVASGPVSLDQRDRGG